MTIIETMARAYCAAYGSDPNEWWESHAREIAAALRAIKPEDVSAAQLEAFTRIMPAHYLPKSKYADDLRRALAAAIVAGAEQ